MNVRKVKRKCGVRGCKCTESYAISLTREAGNTVIICKSCLGKALGAIDEAPTVEKEPRTAIPPLFFGGKPPKAAVEEAPAEATEPTAEEEETEYVCPHCGQVCKSELGLQKHIAAKHKDAE